MWVLHEPQGLELMDGSLFERGKALEDRFFIEKDKQLLQQLKQETAAKEQREALSSASGIKDDTVLDALVANEVSAESLTSVSLIPLVAVAWADGVMESKERDAILKASEKAGIDSDSASMKLLESWLQSQPGDDLLQSWKAYVSSLKENIDAAAFGQLKTTVVGRAKEVADAAGGILGIGKTSSKEAGVIAELEQAFEG